MSNYFNHYFTKNSRPPLEPLEESLDKICKLYTCQKPFKTRPDARYQKYCCPECRKQADIIHMKKATAKHYRKRKAERRKREGLE